MNKSMIVGFVGGLAVAFALAVPAKVFSDGISFHDRDGGASVSVNIGDGDGGHRHHHHRFDHPEIDAAMDHLNQARMNLAKAAHDYAGHRVNALHAVDNALRQCHMAIDYAESHDR